MYSFGYDRWDEGAAELPSPSSFAGSAGAIGRSGSTPTASCPSTRRRPAGEHPAGPAGGAEPGERPPQLHRAAVTKPRGQPRGGHAAPEEIRLLIQGTTPNRVAIIQVSGLRKSGAPSSLVEFQVRLEERTSSVQIIYSPNGFGVTGATVAMKNAFGVLGANLLLSSTPGCGV